MLIVFTIGIFTYYSPGSSFYLGDKFLNRLYQFAGFWGSFISALAFMGVVGTLYISLQSFKHAKKNSDLEHFNTTYYHMLELQQQIISELVFQFNGQTLKGRNLFEFLYDKYDPRDDNTSPLYDDKGNKLIRELSGSKGIKETIESGGIQEYENSDLPTVFDHYFRHLYRIVKFIDDPEHAFLDEKDRRYFYAANLRGTLSKYELVWLYYNCLAGPGAPKFKPLLEKYSLLKNIRSELLAQSFDCKKFVGKANLFDFYIGEKEINDFEYYMSLQQKDKQKEFYISVFYNKNNVAAKIAEYKKWRQKCLQKIRARIKQG